MRELRNISAVSCLSDFRVSGFLFMYTCKCIVVPKTMKTAGPAIAGKSEVTNL